MLQLSVRMNIATRTSYNVLENVPSGTCEKMQIRDSSGIGAQEFLF